MIKFEDEVRGKVAEAQMRALDEIDTIAVDAVRSVVESMLGARYDKWHHVWEFDSYHARHTPMLEAITAKADEIAPQIIEKALAKPITFTVKDLDKLRALFKDKVLGAVEELLEARAGEIAATMIEVLDEPDVPQHVLGPRE